jgi:hypothetical protein
MTQTAASQASDLAVLAQFVLQLFLNYGLPLIVVGLVFLAYTWAVKRLDREAEVRALRAVAARRVERRRNAAARNLQEQTTGREIARRP